MRAVALAVLLFGCGGVQAGSEEVELAGAAPLTACPAPGETRAELEKRLGPAERYCAFLTVTYAQWPEDRTVAYWRYSYAFIWPAAHCGGQSGQLCAWLDGDLGAVASTDAPCELPQGGLCQALAPAP